MANLELGTDGDLLVTNNALTIVEGDAAIRQHLSTRLASKHSFAVLQR
jgi:hypothetical protein